MKFLKKLTSHIKKQIVDEDRSEDYSPLIQIKGPFVIAECGNNHEGDVEIGKKLIDEAKNAGVDAVKFQAGNAEGFARHPSQIPKYLSYELGREGYEELIEHASKVHLPIFFSVWSDDFSDYRFRFKYHKIPARQYNYMEINQRISSVDDASLTLFSIPHTATIEEIIKIGRGRGMCIPFHCVTEYPSLDPMLYRIPLIKMALKTDNVGYSDHTIGIKAAIESYLHYGVRFIEKHFTLAHDFGPLRDHIHSANPSEMKELVDSVKL